MYIPVYAVYVLQDIGGPIKPEELARYFSVSAQHSIKQIPSPSVLMTDGVLEPLEVARVVLVPVTRHMRTHSLFSFPVHCVLSGPRCT
jgi:hypothetical protein